MTSSNRQLTEDISDVVHHYVHACELRPNLGKNTNMCPVDHLWLEQFEVRDVGIVSFELAHVLDLVQFKQDERRIAVAFGVNASQDVVTFFPSVLTSQPPVIYQCLKTSL